MGSGAVIRDYRIKDFRDIKRIHSQGGLDYQMPEINSPLFIVRKVMTVDDKVVGAVLWRIEAETYLLLDKENNLDPEERWMVLKTLQVEGLDALWMKGIDNAVAWIPKDVEKHFAKRLTELGWSPDRDGWRSWSRKTEPKEI
jgi:hypothetical protein